MLMDFDRLRECLALDVGRLGEVAEDLTAPVPSCPGWTVEDLLRHVADGYLRTVSAIFPNGRGGQAPPVARARHAVDLLGWAHSSLVAALTACDREARATRSGQPDAAARFWIRRAAHETTIHRIDAELARPAPVVPMCADEALDGIDEVLREFLSRRSRGRDFAAVLPDRARPPVLTAAGGLGWLVRVTPAGVTVAPASPADPAAATIQGEPQAVLLWLWRRTTGNVRTSGEAALLTELRDLLGHATG